jgi:hypothetical protein
MRIRTSIVVLGAAVVAGSLLSPAASAQKCPAAGAGGAFELYSWRAGDAWRFALLPAVARARNEREIKAHPCRGPEPPLDELRSARMPEVFWFHRRLKGFEYPPEATLRDIRRDSDFLGGLVLYGPPQDGDTAPADAKECRSRDETLVILRGALEARQAELRGQSLELVRIGRQLNETREQVEKAGDVAAMEAFNARVDVNQENGKRLFERLDKLNGEVEVHNRVVDAMLAGCSHRLRSRGDLAPLESPLNEFASVVTGAVDAGQSDDLTRRALLGGIALTAWLSPEGERLGRVTLASSDGQVSSRQRMSPELQRRHVEHLSRGIARQKRIGSMPFGGKLVVTAFYSLVTEPAGRMMEVMVVGYDPEAEKASRTAEEFMSKAVLWHAVARARLQPGEPALPAYQRLVDASFDSFLVASPRP